MKPADLFTLIAILEMPQSCLKFLQADYHNAVAGLPGFKKAVKQQYRRLALQYHPDKNNGNDKKMKEINAAVDVLLQLRIERPQPQPVRIIFQFGGGGFATQNGTTTTATTICTAF